MSAEYQPWKNKEKTTDAFTGGSYTVPEPAPEEPEKAPTAYTYSGGSAPSQSIVPGASNFGGSLSYSDPASNAAYVQAMEALRQAESELPRYNDSYAADINALYAQITGREPFSYDLNSDPLYQQYRDMYMLTGRQAMMDTMGQAAALTGGYGSSYAQSVGQQQYNAYLQQLNNVVPSLYENAYNRWQNEGNDLYNRYSLTQSLADTEYGRYRDNVSDYWQNVSYAQSNADAAYNKALNDRNWQYQLGRDALSDQQTARDNLLESMAIGYTPTAADAAAAGMTEAELAAWLSYIAEQNKPSYSGGGGGGYDDSNEDEEVSIVEPSSEQKTVLKYWQMTDYLDDMIIDGESKFAVLSELGEAYADGNISYDDYNDLYRRYENKTYYDYRNG